MLFDGTGEEMTMMTLAVMSDLHVGLAARAKDLCPKPKKHEIKKRGIYNQKIDSEYRRKFVNFVEQEKITAEYLVLPGDLTNKAIPDEAKLASEFVLQAADALKVAHDKIVFVPGNHDVDWSVLKPDDDTGIRWQQRYVPVGADQFHFKKLVDKGYGNVFSNPYFSVWTFKDLQVIGYNSASHDKPVDEDGAHHGLADPNHINEIRRYLESCNPSSDCVRIFLAHHHPVNYSDPIAEIPDFSAMTNAENLLSLLHQFRFDLFIHGHKHHPRFHAYSTDASPHLPILCSGSFSVDIDTRWAGIVDNQFHLVTVEGRSGTEKIIKGKVTSWAFKHSRGWIPSEEKTSGIHHIIPFGNYVMPNELYACLKPLAIERFREHDSLRWTHVVSKYPDLEHLPINSAIDAFDRLASELDCTPMYETLKDLILLKKDV